MNIKNEMKTIEEGVRYLMATDEKCRNYDLWLLFRYWRDVQGIPVYIPFRQLSEMCLPESIRRVRQKIQQRGELIPTIPEVIIKRRLKQIKMREWAVL